MKNYMKPTLVFAAASTGTTGTCNDSLTVDEKNIIADIIGIENMDMAFGLDESCVFPLDFENYCKYTSTGDRKIFIS